MNVRPARQKEAVQDWETEGGAIAESPRANPTAQAGLNTNHERTGDSSHEQSDCQDPPLAAPRPEAQDLADATNSRYGTSSGTTSATVTAAAVRHR